MYILLQLKKKQWGNDISGIQKPKEIRDNNMNLTPGRIQNASKRIKSVSEKMQNTQRRYNKH